MKNWSIHLLAIVVTIFLLSGCGTGGSEDPTLSSTSPVTPVTPIELPPATPVEPPPATPEDPVPVDPVDPVPTQAAIDPRVLDSAASFLAAATGKENPITVDNVVFVNSVMGLNDVPRQPDCLYGDLWILLRDASGAPILDENGCEIPIAKEPVPILVLDENGNPIAVYDEDGEWVLDENGNQVYQVTYSDYVPMMVEEYKNGLTKCGVVAGFEEYTQALNLGRLNMVRSSLKNPETLARALEEAIKNINAAESVSLDLAGRLILHSVQEVVNAETGASDLIPVEATIDAPRENLALYKALLFEGRIAGYGVAKIGEEGETIPAPWLEIRPDLDLGELSYLREGTEGRDHGVDLINSYADLSVASHFSKLDYHNKMVEFVQYNPPADVTETCLYFDDAADTWERVLESDDFSGTNIAAFAKHADDARKVIVFTHEIIQGLPQGGEAPGYPGMPGYQPPAEDPPGTDPRLLELGASLIGAAANKEVPVNVDAVVFINTVFGINELGITDKGELFGDLWILLRDDDGVPILNATGCVQPIASEPLMVPENFPILDTEGNIIPVFDAGGELTLDEFGLPVYTLIASDTVPLFEEEYMNGATKCAVIPGYEEFTQEFAMGRLNCIRSASEDPKVFEKQLVEAFANLNLGTQLKRDLGGRLVFSIPDVNESGEEILVDYAIDSPLQNLALYRALMLWGKLEGDVTVKMEGKETTVHLALKDDLDLDTHGLGFLRTGGIPNRGIDRLPNGYASYAGFGHGCALDYAGIDVDYVQWHDPQEEGFTCTYTDETGDIWERVLGMDGFEDGGIRAFAKHADDARKVITFTHNIIQDLP